MDLAMLAAAVGLYMWRRNKPDTGSGGTATHEQDTGSASQNSRDTAQGYHSSTETASSLINSCKFNIQLILKVCLPECYYGKYSEISNKKIFSFF